MTRARTRGRALPRRSRWTDDDGSTLPLIAGFVALGLALILLVTAASSLYLAHKRLLTIADGAALAAAEGFELDDVELIGDRVIPRLDDRQVARGVESYLATSATTRQSVVLVAATSPDGRSAVVTLASSWSPPLMSLFVPGGVPIEVTTTARSVFR